MDMSSIVSSNLIQLQQTVQMSVLQSAMNMETVAAVQMLDAMPQTVASHPYKGTAVDIQA